MKRSLARVSGFVDLEWEVIIRYVSTRRLSLERFCEKVWKKIQL